jgi:hypothetical protein
MALLIAGLSLRGVAIMTSSSFTKVAFGTKKGESHSTSASNNKLNAETLHRTPT